jgi:hypothetical protein
MAATNDCQGTQLIVVAVTQACFYDDDDQNRGPNGSLTKRAEGPFDFDKRDFRLMVSCEGRMLW